MGKPTGFLEYKRINAPTRPVEERIRDYKEVYESLPAEELVRQAARCMDCGTPFCHGLGCPLGNIIPEWNDAYYRGRLDEAVARLSETNPFPEITGRVCPAPCETSCTLSINDDPVSIKQLELAIIEEAFDRGDIAPRPPGRSTGKRIAVIGSGPAGLAAASTLRRMGHRVVVFERNDRPGGLLRYGIPDFKLEKWVIDRRIRLMETEGVEFETSVEAGNDLSADYLRRKFDAIVIAAGAETPRDLNIQGRGYEGIHFAMDYLSRSNRYVAGKIGSDRLLSARNKRVLVIGGGDTGSDCIGTAVRQGAKEIHQFEIMPEPLSWNGPGNPQWPDWPRILRTSTSHQEGGERRWAVETERFSGRGVRVEKAYFREVEWKSSGEGKPPRPVPLPGTEFSLDVDLVFLAMGFLHVEHGRFIEDLGLELDSRGNIRIDSAGMTSCGGVFAAGDTVTGASLVVRAIEQGIDISRKVDAYLSP
ncbi:MAG: glutamate synthase subunit beta [Spirochaetia bacterium]